VSAVDEFDNPTTTHTHTYVCSVNIQYLLKKEFPMDIQTVQLIGQVLAWSTVLVGYVVMAMFFYFLLKK
jgi:hypothetical protein